MYNINAIIRAYEESNIELDIGKRWEEGIPHHRKSEELMSHLMAIDTKYCDDHHCFKVGGDGDNGENLMYLMDIYFDLQDSRGTSAAKDTKEV